MTYKEGTRFFSGLFFIAICIIIAAAFVIQVQGGGNALLPILLAVAIFMLFGRLQTTVNGGSLEISFGYLGLIKKTIPLSDIREARVVTYRPLREFGGWGIRSGKFEGERAGCYSMKGDRGVLLSLKHDVRVCLTRTNRVIIGSMEPEKLAASLNREAY